MENYYFIKNFINFNIILHNYNPNSKYFIYKYKNTELYKNISKWNDKKDLINIDKYKNIEYFPFRGLIKINDNLGKTNNGILYDFKKDAYIEYTYEYFFYISDLIPELNNLDNEINYNFDYYFIDRRKPFEGFHNDLWNDFLTLLEDNKIIKKVFKKLKLI